MLAREALLPRRIGRAALFAAAAALAAWPGSSASLATTSVRGYVVTMVLLLARPFFGPARDSRAARFLRVGTCAALLALIPADAAVWQFSQMPPRGGADLRVYRLVASLAAPKPWEGAVLSLILTALYVAPILWMTSRRSRVAPATLAAGVGAGIALGLVVYAVAPLGLSKAATNPWLPGSDIDPLVALAWLLLLGGPVAAAVVADRRYTATGCTPPPAGARIRQMLAAGLLTSMVGALSVTVLGMGTTAVMLKAAWLRDWLYHGQHLLYGVQNLSADLKTLPAIAYSHEITGSVDAQVFHGIIIVFPLIALILTALVAAARGEAAAGRGDPRRGGGGPPGPEPAPGQPDGGQPTVINDDVGLVASLPGLHEPGPGIQQDRLTAALADAAVQPAGMRLSPARRARNLPRETRGTGASRPGDGQRQAVNRGEGTLGGADVTFRAAHEAAAGASAQTRSPAPSWRVTTLPRQSRSLMLRLVRADKRPRSRGDAANWPNGCGIRQRRLYRGKRRTRKSWPASRAGGRGVAILPGVTGSRSR